MDNSQFVIGIDGGGTSTVCLLATANGHIMARADAPGSNHRKADLALVHDSIAEAIRALARQSTGVDSFAPGKLAALCAGLAGVDTERDRTTLRSVLAALAPDAQLLVVNDGEIALRGALESDPGVLVISGTGSIVWAQGQDGRRVRVGGWDYIIGDEGSGYQIGARALRLVAAAHDGRAPATKLTELVLVSFAAADFDDLLEHIYHDAMTPCRIASLAPLVDAAAAEGDAAAACALDETAAELVELTCAAARQVNLDKRRFPVVALGGVLLADGFYARRFRELMKRRASGAFFTAPLHTPAEGAVLLALGMIRPDASHTLVRTAPAAL